jgi:hypothetical protein
LLHRASFANDHDGRVDFDSRRRRRGPAPAFSLKDAGATRARRAGRSYHPPSHPLEAVMPDDKAKFDKEALSLIESLKGRRKPARRAPRTAAAPPGAKPLSKDKAVVRRATGRF